MNSKQKESLSKIILSVYPLSTSSLNCIIESCRIIDYSKLQNLTKAATRNTVEYFLLDGILHSYNINDNGEPVTINFYMPFNVVIPNFVRTVERRSIFFLQALTDTTVAEINAETLDELRKTNDEIKLWGHKVVERELSKSFEREIIFRSQSAGERLIRLRKEFPNLENLVAHSCIASFLGITPVSFSRLRHELAKRK